VEDHPGLRSLDLVAQLDDAYDRAGEAVALNTIAFSMVCDVHLEPQVSLHAHLQRYQREFLPVTRMSAVAVASLMGLAPGAQPMSLQRDFALVNPRNIVSFSVRPADAGAEVPSGEVAAQT
jgi:hypothetical protein